MEESDCPECLFGLSMDSKYLSRNESYARVHSSCSICWSDSARWWTCTQYLRSSNESAGAAGSNLTGDLADSLLSLLLTLTLSACAYFSEVCCSSKSGALKQVSAIPCLRPSSCLD